MQLDLLDAFVAAGWAGEEALADRGAWRAAAAGDPVGAALQRAGAALLCGAPGAAERLITDIIQYQNNENQNIIALSRALVARARHGLCVTGRAIALPDGPDASAALSEVLAAQGPQGPAEGALLATCMIPVELYNHTLDRGLVGADFSPAPPVDPPGLVALGQEPALSAWAARRLARLRQVAGDQAGALSWLDEAGRRDGGRGVGGVITGLMRFDALVLGGLPWVTDGALPAATDRGEHRADLLLAPLEQQGDPRAAREALAGLEGGSLAPWINAEISARRAWLAGSVEGWEEAADRAEAAGDGWLWAVALTRRELARIQAGRPARPEVVGSLGAWARGEGSRSWASTLLFSALRWGWRRSELHLDLIAGQRAAAFAAAGLERLEAPAQRCLALEGLAGLTRRARGPRATVPVLEQLGAAGEVLEAQGHPLGRSFRWSALLGRLQVVRRAAEVEGLKAQLQDLLDAPAPDDERFTAALDQAGARDLGRVAALTAAGEAAELGDEAGLAAALAALERGLDGLSPEAEPLHRATLAAWREDWAGAREHALAWINAQPAPAPLQFEGADLLDPARIASTEAARQAGARRSDRILTLRILVQCQAWEDARAALEALDAEGGPASWEDPAEPWVGWADRAEVQLGLGALDEALVACEQARRRMEARRARVAGDEGRSALSREGDALRIGRIGLNVALRRGQVAEAFRWSELARSTALAELLAASRVPLESGAPPALLAWRGATARVQAWTERLAMCAPSARGEALARLQAEQAALPGLEAALAELPPRLQGWARPELRPVALDEVPTLLPPDAAYLSVGYGAEHLELFWVPAEGEPGVFTAPVPRKELVMLARKVGRAAALGQPVEDGARALAELLLAPLGPRLGQIDHLILAPQGALHTLPWTALPLFGEALGARLALTRAPNAASLPHILFDVKISNQDRALIVGDPCRMSWVDLSGRERRLPALPGAADEARRIAARFHEPTLLLGEAARRDPVLEALPGARLVHLASHGVTEPEDPLGAAVLLAEGEALRVADWMGLSTRAALVTLSACETGLGEVEAGSEVLGLGRALLAAGAGSALVSLWPVHDRATRLWMDAFYASLLGGRSPAFAARDARRALLALADDEEAEGPSRDLRLGVERRGTGYDHPRHWAPFELLG